MCFPGVLDENVDAWVVLFDAMKVPEGARPYDIAVLAEIHGAGDVGDTVLKVLTMQSIIHSDQLKTGENSGFKQRPVDHNYKY